MTPKVSVIIPVYNAEKYLKRCLDSLIQARIDEFETEILLVNDGSTDNSLEIAKQYEKEVDFIKVYSQENKGPSVARNLGIKQAEGEWVTFVDSDDWVVESYFKIIRENLDIETDILVFGYIKIVNDLKTKHFFNNEILDKEGIIKIIKSSSDKMPLFWFPWTKVYKKVLLDSIEFNPKIKIGEDTIFNMEVFTKATKIQIIEECLYNYFTNEDSLTQVKYRPKLLENMVAHYEGRKDIHQSTNSIETSEYDEDIAHYYIDHILFWLIGNTNNSPKTVSRKLELQRIRNSKIYHECFKHYKYKWKLSKKIIIIKLFELKQFNILLKLL